MVRRDLISSILAMVCLTLVLVPLPVKAQSAASATLYISVNPTTVVAGEWAGVSAVVINNSGAKLRTTVTFKAVDPCGTVTDLGYNRLALAPGQSVLVTTAYPTKANSCRGTHAVTVTAGGTKSLGPSATTYLEVQ